MSQMIPSEMQKNYYLLIFFFYFQINLAVQCLSTDFSTQKGVKGMPLHVQIDTYDDPRDPSCPVYHRAYAQVLFELLIDLQKIS